MRPARIFSTSSRSLLGGASRGASALDYAILTSLLSLVVILAATTIGERGSRALEFTALELFFAVNEEDNFFDNGDFDDTTGATEKSFGFSTGNIAGWTEARGLDFELHSSGYGGMESITGGYWLDMAESPGAMNISQTVDDLAFGRLYKLTLFAGDRSATLENATFVFWNGDFIGRLTGDVPGEMREFVFYIQAGAGDGTDTLNLQEIDTGGSDNEGMSIDVVRIWGRGDD